MPFNTFQQLKNSEGCNSTNGFFLYLLSNLSGNKYYFSRFERLCLLENKPPRKHFVFFFPWSVCCRGNSQWWQVKCHRREIGFELLSLPSESGRLARTTALARLCSCKSTFDNLLILSLLHLELSIFFRDSVKVVCVVLYSRYANGMVVMEVEGFFHFHPLLKAL